MLDPAEVRKNREQELNESSLEDLKEHYRTTYHKEPELVETDDEDTQKKNLIIDILAGSPAPPSPRQEPEGAPLEEEEERGDKRVKLKNGREHVIKASNLDHVVVRQVQVQRVGNDVVELPSTEQIQAYHPEQFQKMVDDKFFSDSNMRVEVLHKP